MSDVKNIFVLCQNTNEVYVVQFLARLDEKRQNEKEKSLGGGSTYSPPPCDAARCRGSLRVDPLRVNVSKIDICGAGHRDISSLCIRIVTV